MQSESWPERVGRRCAEISITWRWLVIALTLVACLGVGYGASNLKFAGDYRVFFGAENPDFLANEEAQATFGKPDNLAFVIIPKDGSIYTEETLGAVHALTEKAWRLPYASRVDSLTNFQATRGEGDDLIVEDLLFDPADLNAARIAEIKRVAKSEPLIHGFVVSRDGRATLVNAVLQLPADVANVYSQAATAAREIRREVVAEHPGVEIHLIGVAMLGASFEEAGLRDSQTLIPLVYLLIVVVIGIALRSVGAVICSVAVIGLSTVIAVGVGGLSGVLLTPISLSAPTIVLTIAVADAIHILVAIRQQMQAGASKREAITAGVALNFTPIAITSITTVVGFLTLNFSDSPPFHHLGNMTAAGIAAAWILCITFLPALLSLLPLGFRPKARVGTAGLVDGVAELVISRPRAFLIGALAVSATSIAFIPSLTINDQWSQYFDRSLEFRQAIDAADPFFGSDQIEFVLDPGAPGAVTDPEFLTVVSAFTEWLRAQSDHVAHAYSVSDIVKRINRNLNAEDPAFFRIPQDQNLIGQYLLVYELSLPFGLALTDRVDIDRQSTRVTATVKDISTADTRAFIERARAWFAANGAAHASLTVTGSKTLFTYVADRNIEAMFEGALYLILAIFAILATAFRSVSLGALSLLPNALPILVTFGVWAMLFGVVGFSIAAVGAVAVGLVVDFTVHFLAKYLRAREDKGESVEDAIRYAFRTAGVAIFATTMILAAGFAALVTSTFKLNADLGLLTAIAVVLAMIVNFVVLPALFVLWSARGQARPQSAAETV